MSDLLSPTAAALLREANEAHAELVRVVKASGPVIAETGSSSSINVFGWLSDDPTHARIYAALERLVMARAQLAIVLRLDYAAAAKSAKAAEP